MAFLVFTAIRRARRTMPGEYGTKDGYVYAIYCESGYVKVGSSRNPRCRINEIMGNSCTMGFDGKEWRSICKPVRMILISGRHNQYRGIEERFHDALHDWRIGHYNSESYRLPKSIRDALKQAFESDLSEASLMTLERLIDPAQFQEAA